VGTKQQIRKLVKMQNVWQTILPKFTEGIVDNGLADDILIESPL
jgi:hypothetical protein